MPKNVLKNPGRALENGASVVIAFASRNTGAAFSSLLEVISFFSRRKRIIPLENCLILCHLNGTETPKLYPSPPFRSPTMV